MIRNPQDGRVHHSELKAFADSAAHYRHACESKREVTRAMTIGAVVDRLVFGGRVAVWNGTRAQKGYESWAQDHVQGTVLCTATEHVEASATAACVLADPVAGPLIRDEANEFQRVMQWSAYGLECAAGIAGEHGRGGFDILNQRESCILDLKASADAEPERLQRHARRMWWHTQGRWYLDGAQALGLDATRFKLIVVETTGLACTVLNVGPRTLESAAKSLTHWAEQLRACDSSGQWPGYCQSEVEWDEDEQERGGW